MPNLLLIRASVAAVWIYQGLWCKVLGNATRQQAILDSVPFLNDAQAHSALMLLGAAECLLAAWVLWGRAPFGAALAQTILLAMMNAGGIAWASRIIPDAPGMLLQNFAFLLLAWIAAGEAHPHDARS